MASTDKRASEEVQQSEIFKLTLLQKIAEETADRWLSIMLGSMYQTGIPVEKISALKQCLNFYYQPSEKFIVYKSYKETIERNFNNHITPEKFKEFRELLVKDNLERLEKQLANYQHCNLIDISLCCESMFREETHWSQLYANIFGNKSSRTLMYFFAEKCSLTLEVKLNNLEKNVYVYDTYQSGSSLIGKESQPAQFAAEFDRLKKAEQASANKNKIPLENVLSSIKTPSQPVLEQNEKTVTNTIASPPTLRRSL